MKKFNLCCMALLCLFLNGSAQSHSAQVQIGDRMPEIMINHVLNYPEPGVSLSAYKDKLVIIDFISTWCGTCIRSIDKLQQLQAEFKEDLQVLVVTGQSATEVQPVIAKRGWTLPVAVGDTLLSGLFPHQRVPHQVWIHEGRVVAITGHQYATAENIRKVMSGQELKTHLKQEQPFDLSRPLLSAGHKLQPFYQSAITPPLNNGGAGTRRTHNSFLMYNAALPDLYLKAFNMPAFPTRAYVRLEVSDSLRQLIQGPGGGITGNYAHDKAYVDWEQQYTYCYNLAFPEINTVPFERFRSIMRQDLNNFFSVALGVTGKIAKRKVVCLALKRTKYTAALTTRGGKPRVKSEGGNYRLTNKPLSLLISSIAYRHSQMGMPVVDITGFTGNVDMKIEGGLGDLERVNEELERYGLALQVEELEIDMLVIKETQ